MTLFFVLICLIESNVFICVNSHSVVVSVVHKSNYFQDKILNQALNCVNSLVKEQRIFPENWTVVINSSNIEAPILNRIKQAIDIKDDMYLSAIIGPENTADVKWFHSYSRKRVIPHLVPFQQFDFSDYLDSLIKMTRSFKILEVRAKRKEF